MTDWQRAASRTATDTEAQPSNGRGDSSRLEERFPAWEDLFHSFPPSQRTELLSLARNQGFLYGHQLPKNENGCREETSRLTALLQGGDCDLEPVRATPIDLVDHDLDGIQREAVYKALQTPDVCLIQGLPGTGKTRVSAEVVLQAARRGERVLLLCPNAAGVDRILELIGLDDGLCPVRLLSSEEKMDRLSEKVRPLVFEERVRQLRDQPILCAKQMLASMEQQARRLEAASAVLERCRSLIERRIQNDEALRRCQARREMIAADVATLADRAISSTSENIQDPFAASLCELHRSCEFEKEHFEQALAQAHRIVENQRVEMDQAESRLREVEELLASRRSGQWWTVSWWRAWFAGNLDAAVTASRASCSQSRGSLDLLLDQVQNHTRERELAIERYHEQRGLRIEEEIARQRAVLDAEHASLLEERAGVIRTLDTELGGLDHLSSGLTGHGAELTSEDFETALAECKRQFTRTESERESVGQWLQCLEEAAETVPSRLMGIANVVASPITTLACDRQFGETNAPFDLLVLYDAHQVEAPDVLAMARRCRRWLLVGEAPTALATAPCDWFQELWQRLHCDPRRLTYAWHREMGRWCCRLRPIREEDRGLIEKEFVADCPDIELRILASDQPQIVEVVFPPSMSLYQAKEYIFKELQELAVSTPGGRLSWVEEPDRVVLRLGETTWQNAIPVALEAGVREVVTVSADRPCTCGLEFDRDKGWDRLTAENWVAGHLGLRDLGRTVRLDVPHRMHPDLAAFVSELLFDGAYRVLHGSNFVDGNLTIGSCRIEFVPVWQPPALAKDQRGRTRSGKGKAATASVAPFTLPKNGAGLEINLQETRHRERVPTEFRSGLPQQGFANLEEAQSIVRWLERFAVELGSQARNGGVHTVAVTALYPGQVELIRELARVSGVLQQAHFELVVDQPASLRQRDFHVLLVSLTRSHSHRAVAFGEGPHVLAQALTRARSRLILFGDPGTLARRTQWEGAVDHLDQDRAQLERAWVHHLLLYLQGHGPHQMAFHLHQGTPL